MKTIAIPYVAFLLFSGGQPGEGLQMRTPASFGTGIQLETPSSYTCLPKPDAEKILGQAAELKDHSSEEESNVIRHRCTYQAISTDPERPCNLYFVLELYNDAGSAHNAYTGILTANTRMPGQSTISSIGDEAWLHSGAENFHLIIFRKANKMVRVKVNKITGTTSLGQLQDVVKRISQEI